MSEMMSSSKLVYVTFTRNILWQQLILNGKQNIYSLKLRRSLNVCCWAIFNQIKKFDCKMVVANSIAPDVFKIVYKYDGMEHG